MAISIADWFNQKYSQQLATPGSGFRTFDALNPNQKQYQVAQYLPNLEQNKLYSFSNPDAQTSFGTTNFLLQGNKFIPVLGDASQYGAPTPLGFSTQDVYATTGSSGGFTVAPPSAGISPTQTPAQA